jgi:hypothetical protein
MNNYKMTDSQLDAMISMSEKIEKAYRAAGKTADADRAKEHNCSLKAERDSRKATA